MTSKKPMRAEVYRDDDKRWRWRIVHNSNGNTLADGGQSYTAKADCLHGLDLVAGGNKNVRVVEVAS